MTLSVNSLKIYNSPVDREAIEWVKRGRAERKNLVKFKLI